jgi:hypothetical protein
VCKLMSPSSVSDVSDPRYMIVLGIASRLRTRGRGRSFTVVMLNGGKMMVVFMQLYITADMQRLMKRITNRIMKGIMTRTNGTQYTLPDSTRQYKIIRTAQTRH